MGRGRGDARRRRPRGGLVLRQALRCRGWPAGEPAACRLSQAWVAARPLSISAPMVACGALKSVALTPRSSMNTVRSLSLGWMYLALAFSVRYEPSATAKLLSVSMRTLSGL